MGLMSMININEDRKERNTAKTAEKSKTKKDFGYSLYEALEYSGNKKIQGTFGLQAEIIKNFIR